jgi:hypothetical protein
LGHQLGGNLFGEQGVEDPATRPATPAITKFL